MTHTRGRVHHRYGQIHQRHAVRIMLYVIKRDSHTCTRSRVIRLANTETLLLIGRRARLYHIHTTASGIHFGATSIKRLFNTAAPGRRCRLVPDRNRAAGVRAPKILWVGWRVWWLSRTPHSDRNDLHNSLLHNMQNVRQPNAGQSSKLPHSPTQHYPHHNGVWVCVLVRSFAAPVRDTQKRTHKSINSLFSIQLGRATSAASVVGGGACHAVMRVKISFIIFG